MFNVCSLVLMIYVRVFLGHFRSKVFMLTLSIIFCLIYVLVRACLGCWGYILKQSFLCSPVSLSWFPQSPTPVSTPNTCIVTGFFFRKLPSFPSAFVVFSVVLPMPVLPVLRWRPHFQYIGTPNAWRKDLCELVLCHLVSSCVIVQTCSHVFFGDGMWWCWFWTFVSAIFGFSSNHGGSKPHNSQRVLGSWAKWIGERSVPLIFGSGVSLAVAWNATEQDRMARAIQKRHFRPKNPKMKTKKSMMKNIKNNLERWQTKRLKDISVWKKWEM